MKAPPLVAAALGVILGGSLAQAGSATWLPHPISADWNTADNWTAGGPPNSATDTATFQFSTVRDLSLSANTELSSILFSNGGATAYSITVGNSIALTISGSGITNNSGIIQNFVVRGTEGVIRFANDAAAAFNAAITTHGAEVSGPFAGLTEFRDSSSAENASFTTNGGAVEGAFGGVTQFLHNSTAAQGTFTNHGGAVTGAGTGVTIFYNTSTASSATFTNGPSVIGNVGGFTGFLDSSTAAHATFTNNGATETHGGSGVTAFFDNSTADHGTFINNGGTAFEAQGGITDFYDNSTAGNGAFDIKGGAISGADAAFVRFFDSSTAANGRFLNRGGPIRGAAGGTIEFYDSASAGNAVVVTNGAAVNGAGNGYTVFRNSSTAGNATFTTNGGASAGTGGGGLTEFIHNSTAANAKFTINSAPVSDGSGGGTHFRNNSSAGRGTFTVNGSAFRAQVCPPGFFCGDYPTPAAVLFFGETATAGDATLIALGGTEGGDGALIVFGPPASNGGAARVKVFGNARLDISGLFGTFYDPQNDPGTTIGSIEGDGLAFLGANRLGIGANNLSTTFSGVIQDGGINGQSGGSLVKIGGGTLTLSGANTYTGATTVNEGTLSVNGSITSDVTINQGGTLGGSGTIGSVTVENGGILGPGDSLGVLTINGSYAQKAGGVLKIEVAGADPGASDHLEIAGSATIDGTLEVRFLNGFLPVTGQVFKLFHVPGAFAGSFGQIIFPDLRTGFQFKAEFVNGSYQITALNDGVAARGFLNLSTRTRVGLGDNALIGGFIITGNASKKVIVRALGPSLAINGAPLPNRLPDPALELRNNAGGLIFSNDNWIDSPQKQEIIDSTIPPGDDREAAIVATLPPGNYTAIMRGVNNSAGIGVLEVYDVAQVFSSSLANISSRGLVETGDNVMIGGFIVDRQASQLIVRAIGPSLAQSGIANALADPTVELYNGDGNIIAFNNDWQDTDKEAIEATGIPPVNDKESVILATLAPGNYTAIVRGQNESVGVGLVEVYHVQ